MADRGTNEPRYPCKVCGRQFFQDSLAKHEPICLKNTKSKRKVFDSTKQRADGSDLTLRQIKAAQKKEVAPPKSNWRAKHEDFINTVRAARGVSKIMAAGGPLPPPPPPSINPDYIQCPYCSRRFSQSAADRHINFCKEQSQRINTRAPPNPAAKAKQATRLNYQPPKPKGRGAPPPAAAQPVTSPSGSGSGSRMPGAAGARGPAGGARSTGMGAPAQRGRGGATYQAMTVAGARTGTQQNHTKMPATSGHDREKNVLRNTTTISNTPHSVAFDSSSQTVARQSKGFAYNPHPKLSGIRDRAIGDFDNRLASEEQYSDRSRREPAFAEDFYDSSRETSPEYNESLYQSPLDYFHPSAQITYRNGVGAGTSTGAGAGAGRKPNRGTVAATAMVPMSKFCHECGTRYPVASAKFCCECGMRRMAVS